MLCDLSGAQLIDWLLMLLLQKIQQKRREVHAIPTPNQYFLTTVEVQKSRKVQCKNMI